MYNFLTSTDPANQPYVDNIWAYNNVLAFTSLGVNFDQELANAKEGVYTFRIQGALYHRIGGLKPKEDTTLPAFAQIYFYDTNMNKQLQRRQEIFPHLDPNMLQILQNMLYTIPNPFVHKFMNVG